MKALIFEEPQHLRLGSRATPTVASEDDVLVRVKYTGICGTDRNIVLGHFPARQGVILGHECVGAVEDLGDDVWGVEEDDRVIIDPTLYCGYCPYCRQGRTHLCDNKAGTEVGVDRDGGIAEYIRLSQRFVHKIPEDMSFKRAVLVEPLACVLNNARAARLRPDDEVAVIGGGPIGVLWALFAQKAATKVRVFESDPSRQEKATRLLGENSVVAEVDDCTARNGWSGRGPSVVVDTTGTLLETALDLVDKGGRVVLMGFNSSYEGRVPTLGVTTRGIKIVGAGDYSSDLFPTAIRVASTLRLEDVVSDTLGPECFRDAFRLLGVELSENGSGLQADVPHEGGSYQAMKVVFDLS